MVSQRKEMRVQFMKRLFFLACTLSLAMMLAACGGNDESEESPEGIEQEQTFELSEDEKVNDEEIVVNVNGSDVTGDRYNLAYLQTKAQLFQYGQDTSDKDSVKDLALDALVEQELLEQDAQEKGVEVSEEEIESEFETIKSEDEDRFKDFLDEYHFTEESVKLQLSFAMLYDKYIETEFPDIEVTEEELEETYNELKEQNEELADLEEIEDLLRTELTQQKEAEKMQERIEDLKGKADIEKKI